MTFTSSKSRTIVGLAVAAALAAPMIASAATVAVDFRKSSPDVLKVAKELLATKITTINGVVALIPVPMTANYSVGGANSFYMTITLGAGLTAKASPNLACKVSGGAINPNVATLQSGGAGKSSFTFAIKTGIALAGNAASGYCYLTSAGTALAFTNTGATSKTIAWKSTRVVGGSNVSVTAAAKSFITFTKAASASITIGNTGGLINVAANSMKLTSGASKPQTDLVSVVGVVSYKQVTGVVGATAAQTVLVADFAKSATLTIAGDPVATSKKVLLTPVGGATCTAGAIASAVASSGKVTFTGAALTTTLTGPGAKVCLVFSGSTAITAGQITAVLGTKNAATLGYNPDFSFSPDNNMLNLKKNGKSAKVFNLALPSATSIASGTYDSSILRFVNLGSPGTVRATVYKGDGTIAGTGVILTVTEFPKGASVSLKYEDVLTKLSIVPPIEGAAPTGTTGNYKRSWLQIDGEVSNMSVMHLSARAVNGSSGPTVNMSSTVTTE